ncbi:hypothetical protein OG252_13385 [Streptomyces sp. NBC_01352]|uniref:hypothetical protein n=1 Tax=Streptomyces sp. NBC_01352 TaxID=2903834 RepID=UPI002E343931|nr:hypothetical protein [Streptomyces sp. NBC_01352]
MSDFDHDHDHTENGFEPGCPACEVDEVSLQDTGRSWAARAIKHPSHLPTRRHFAKNPLPGQQDRRTA